MKRWMLLVFVVGCGMDLSGMSQEGADASPGSDAFVRRGQQVIGDSGVMASGGVGGTDTGGGGVAGGAAGTVTGGSGGMTMGGSGGVQEACVPQVEICNNRDDNCDSVVDDGNVCPDLVRRDDHTYIFGDTLMTWVAARAWCQQFGRDLVIVNDQTENDWIGAQAIDRSVNGRWIGLTDVAIEGTWMWTDSNSFVFSAWAIGQPNNNAPGDGEDCVALIPGTSGVSTTGWNDMRCDSGADPNGYAKAVCEGHP